MFVPFEKLFKDIDSFVGSEVSISGMLNVDVDNKSYLASDYEGFLREERLLILDDSQITKFLLLTLPVSGGGKVIFYFETMIVAKVTINSGHHVLSEPSLVKVTYEGTAYEVPLKK